MTRDDIHKLIAGYATGTLTPEEREALFTAALDDQDLFDELAREQEWKDVLEEPGVRQRLIASLEPPALKQAWWNKRHWSWAAAATVAAILLGVYLSQPGEPKRLAINIPQTRPAPGTPAPFVAPPPEDQPAPALPTPAAVERGRRGVTPLLPPPPQPAAVMEQKLADQTAPRQEAAAPKPAAAPPPPAASPPPAARLNTESQVVPLPSAGAARGGGGGRGAVGGFVQNQFRAATEFGVDYSVTTERRLRVIPSSSGFLSVSAAGQVLVSNRPLAAGAATEVPLPEEATSSTVVYSAQPITDSILNLAKSSLDAPAGTKLDPNPTPAARVELVIPIPPRQ